MSVYYSPFDSGDGEFVGWQGTDCSFDKPHLFLFSWNCSLVEQLASKRIQWRGIWYTSFLCSRLLFLYFFILLIILLCLYSIFNNFIYSYHILSFFILLFFFLNTLMLLSLISVLILFCFQFNNKFKVVNIKLHLQPQ